MRQRAVLTITLVTAAALWPTAGRAGEGIVAKKLKSMFAGSPHTESLKLNNDGEAVGYSINADWTSSAAVLWTERGKPRQLPCRGADTACYANAINNLGVAVGESDNENEWTPVQWDENGRLHTLPIPAGKWGAEALDINDSGWIVGLTWDPAEKDYRRTGILWREGKAPRKLRPLRGDDQSQATAVSNAPSGKVVAVGLSSATVDGFVVDRAVVWNDRGKPKVLRPLAGDSDSMAWGINRAGIIAGHSNRGNVYTAVVWGADRRPVALELLEGCEGSHAAGINDAGFVAGYNSLCQERGDRGGVPVIWDPEGRVHELPMPAGVKECGARSINELGEIVGWAWYKNSLVGVQWR